MISRCPYCGRRLRHIGTSDIPVPAADYRLAYTACTHCETVYATEYFSADDSVVTRELGEEEVRRLLEELDDLDYRAPGAGRTLRRILASITSDE